MIARSIKEIQTIDVMGRCFAFVAWLLATSYTQSEIGSRFSPYRGGSTWTDPSGRRRGGVESLCVPNYVCLLSNIVRDTLACFILKDLLGRGLCSDCLAFSRYSGTG